MGGWATCLNNTHNTKQSAATFCWTSATKCNLAGEEEDDDDDEGEVFKTSQNA